MLTCRYLTLKEWHRVKSDITKRFPAVDCKLKTFRTNNERARVYVLTMKVFQWSKVKSYTTKIFTANGFLKVQWLTIHCKPLKPTAETVALLC